MAKWNLDKLPNKGKTMTKYSRSEILDTAKKYVTKDRAEQHGDLEENFDKIADLWNCYLEGSYISVTDVGVMMALLKIARVRSNPKNIDNFVDGAGYLACSGELSAKEPEPEVKAVNFQGGNV